MYGLKIKMAYKSTKSLLKSNILRFSTIIGILHYIEYLLSSYFYSTIIHVHVDYFESVFHRFEQTILWTQIVCVKIRCIGHTYHGMSTLWWAIVGGVKGATIGLNISSFTIHFLHWNANKQLDKFELNLD